MNTESSALVGGDWPRMVIAPIAFAGRRFPGLPQKSIHPPHSNNLREASECSWTRVHLPHRSRRRSN